MKYNRVVVKQLPDEVAEASGLAKYGKSKMPGVLDIFQVARNPRDGRFLTGIDENAFSVKSIKDAAEREKKQAELKELRESLERTIGKDLSALSPFWEDEFLITIDSNSDLNLYGVNPSDVLIYHALIANGYAAPNKEAGSNPEYLKAKYYCHIDENVDQQEISTFKARDKARSLLLDVVEDVDHSILIGQYLVGDAFKKGMREATVYRMLSDFIEKKTEPENVKKFTKAASLPIEDLTYKVTIDRAMRKKIIKYNNKYWQRGQVTLGKTPDEVYSNLQKPDFATEFLSIKEELEEA